MTAPTSSSTAAADDARSSAEARELADYLASQSPLDAEAALWLARRQDGLTAEEEAELQDWLAGDPARGARLDQLSGLLGQLDELPPDDVAALKASLAPVPHTSPTNGNAAPPHRRKPAHQPERRQWLLGWGRLFPQVAMAGMAALLIGGGWMGWSHWQQQPTFTQSFATVRGQQATATLPDGSTLKLDTATQLNVALYNQHREVRLPAGQALFEVKADPQRPFHVLAGPMRITVLGTRFSVRHTPGGMGGDGVSVVVEEGRVRVARAVDASADEMSLSDAENDAVELTAGQAVMADGQGHIAAVTRSTPNTAMAWRDGRVVLNDTPLGAAVAEFERYLDTGLVITDPAVAALRLNGSFDLRKIQAFKRALPQVLPVRLKPRADGQTEVTAVN